jgi:hypothetical protein
VLSFQSAPCPAFERIGHVEFKVGKRDADAPWGTRPGSGCLGPHLFLLLPSLLDRFSVLIPAATVLGRDQSS